MPTVNLKQDTIEALVKIIKSSPDLHVGPSDAEITKAIQAFNQNYPDFGLDSAVDASGSHESSLLKHIFSNEIFSLTSNKGAEFAQDAAVAHWKTLDSQFPSSPRPLHAQPANLGLKGKLDQGSLGANVWLNDVDLRQALAQLSDAQTEAKQPALAQVKIATFEQESIKNAINEAKPADQQTPYTLHLIINNSNSLANQGSHWTRLKITVSAEGATINADYVDSLNDPDGTKAQRVKEALERELKAAFGEDKSITVNTEFTAKQQDGYSCGYIALADTARDIGIEQVPDTDLRGNRQKSDALRDWVYQLVLGREQFQTWQQTQGEFRPIPTAHQPKPRTAREPQTSGLLTSATQKQQIFSEEKKARLESWAKECHFECTFSNVTQSYKLSIPVTSSTSEQSELDKVKASKTEVNITTNTVSVKRTDHLDNAGKKQLAKKMVEAFIVNTTGKSLDKLSKEELSGITIKPITGSDNALKVFINRELQSKGITLERTIAPTTSTKPETQLKDEDTHRLRP